MTLEGASTTSQHHLTRNAAAPPSHTNHHPINEQSRDTWSLAMTLEGASTTSQHHLTRNAAAPPSLTSADNLSKRLVE